MNVNGILAEFVGTTIFLYVIIATRNAWLIGLTLALVISLFGNISGGYFNPAVTILMVISKKESSKQLIPYILAQLLAVPATYFLYKYKGSLHIPF